MKRIPLFVIPLLVLLLPGCPTEQNNDPPAAGAEILTFVFAEADNAALDDDYTGIISGLSIAFSLPYGTDVTALIPSISVSEGAVVSPASGSAQNFTSPVAYTVTAEDGTTKNTYTVGVVIGNPPLRSEAEILTFVFNDVDNDALNDDYTGTITGPDIAVDVPYGTDVAALVPTIAISDSAAVSPASGSAQNFTAPVNYTVTAEDGITDNTYTVTVTILPDAAKEMTYFAFLAADNPALSADISVAVTDTLVRLNVPHGTALDTLVASFAITGESAVTEGVVQESGVTVNDFSADLVYTVTAADGGTQDYTVRIYTTVDRRQLDSMIAGDEDITRLDTSGITDMSYLFSRMTSFNQDIGDWDVSNVTDMSVMFGSALSFNQDISGWDVSSVMNMDSMFYAANAFNQDIGNWNVSNVTSMNTMFGYATAFNQDIGNWDVGNVTDMSYMFRDTESFNQDLSSWADHVTETIVHNDFSYGTCPLMTAYHPYPGWDN